MTQPDPAIVASYRRAIARAGLSAVTFKRITGFAPNTAVVSATVQAVVRDYNPDTTSVAQTGYAATKLGAMTEGDRMIIVMATDLFDARFPLPLKKNDKVVIVETGEELNITVVDASKRAVAGAIELKASGVH